MWPPRISPSQWTEKFLKSSRTVAACECYFHKKTLQHYPILITGGKSMAINFTRMWIWQISRRIIVCQPFRTNRLKKRKRSNIALNSGQKCWTKNRSLSTRLKMTNYIQQYHVYIYPMQRTSLNTEGMLSQIVLIQIVVARAYNRFQTTDRQLLCKPHNHMIKMR